MKIDVVNIRKSINKAFLKVKPNRPQIENFKKNILNLYDQINESESEEFHKNIISTFLKETYYSPNYYINTKGRTDLVIHNGKNTSTTVGVLIETKKPSNNSEMPTKENINTKALQELVLYYLRERVSGNNIEIKQLIITNIYEWFIFNANEFERLFVQDKKLVKKFIDFEEARLSGTTTDFFYKQIAEPFINQLDSEISFTYVDIRGYEKVIRNNDKLDDNKLVALFKLFSPENLLKLPFANDSNSLDKGFYSELLHIIGLQETKEGSKKLIGRKPEKERNAGSLIENTITILKYEDCLSQIKASDYGETKDEQLYNVSLELVITWINRILFLKLLEGQLVKYHSGDKTYKFLDSQKISDFDALNKLFFQILAIKENERNDLVKQKFEKIPYLNSSLFEPNDLEHKTIRVSNLEDEYSIPIINSTVFKDKTGKRKQGDINALEYMFAFLDAYDFASEGAEEIQEENKTLMNASVLGLIFEKINGYKDGSFFTPGFITMYMCRETIRKAVVQKFNETKGWNCTSIDDVYDKIENKKEANAIINSLKICDPAVGSGHFLVSALNEIIAIKSELKILIDLEGRTLRDYHIEVANDELVITDDEGQLFEYKPSSKESQRIQETLFHEKQTIIESCLFGVDINPNSVKICRLRLWIELLKNTYYKKDTERLETLPNIDINIKCGNSLISRYALDADIKKALKSSKWSIDSYRLAVMTYLNAQSKDEKRAMEKLIDEIKNDFVTEIRREDRKLKELNNWKQQLFSLTNQQLFDIEQKQKKAWNKKVQDLTKKIERRELEFKALKNNKVYENAFEWRFEFPEVLNDEGDFVGFDVIIGNPPYMLLQNLHKEEERYLKSTFKTALYKGDTFGVFIEFSFKVTDDNGILNLIVPYTWMSIQQHLELRKLILNSGLDYVIDLPQKVFENADLDTTILQVSKNNFQQDSFQIGKAENRQIEIRSEGIKSYYKQNNFWQINLNIVLDDISILQKVKSDSVKLESVFEVSQGYIPYRRSDLIKEYGAEQGNKIVDERLWHSKEHISDDFKQEIQGRDLKRFKYSESFQYVKYGKHLAGYVYPKFFKNPRILVMEVTRGDRYKIKASFVEKELYNTPSIINIIHPQNDLKYLYYLTGLLNSSLFTWYHLKEHSKSQANTSIPKILVREIRNLPIKDVNLNDQEPIIKLVEQAIISEINLIDDISRKIDNQVYKLYNLSPQEIQIVEESLN